MEKVGYALEQRISSLSNKSGPEEPKASHSQLLTSPSMGKPPLAWPTTMSHPLKKPDEPDEANKTLSDAVLGQVHSMSSHNSFGRNSHKVPSRIKLWYPAFCIFETFDYDWTGFEPARSRLGCQCLVQRAFKQLLDGFWAIKTRNSLPDHTRLRPESHQLLC